MSSSRLNVKKLCNLNVNLKLLLCRCKTANAKLKKIHFILTPLNFAHMVVLLSNLLDSVCVYVCACLCVCVCVYRNSVSDHFRI